MKTFNECMNTIKSHQDKVPVDVIAIAKDFGVKVFKAQNWEDKISGMIKKEGDDYNIYVNPDHPLTRQRFTIAHELAHFVLHKYHIDKQGLIADDGLYRSGLTNAVEAEANILAADILMPRDRVSVLWDDPSSTLDSIAKAFNVSEDAMAVRLGVPN